MWLNSRLQSLAAARPRVRFLLFLSLGLLASMGQAPFGMPMLSLLGFAAILLVFPISQSWRSAAWMGWVFGLGYFILTMQWLVSPFMVEPERHAWMAPFAVLMMSGGLALFWAAAFAAARRFGAGALILTLPLAELARAYVLTGFPWGMPAYGLVDRYFAQGAAWGGSHALNIAFIAVAFAGAVVIGENGLRRYLGLGVVTAGLIALLPGPAPTPAGPDAPVIRLIQPNAPQRQKWDPDYMSIFFDRALAYTAAEGQPDLILWPETSLPGALPNGQDLIDQISSAAGGVPYVVGSNRFDGIELRNAAAFVDDTGLITQVYDKYHLVPFGEYVPFGEVLAKVGIHGLAASQGMGFAPGTGAELMDLGALGRALPLICYEAVFPQDVARSSERPDLLMQITNDAWFGTFSGPYQHLVQAQMRAIEQGLPFVRAANTGVSAMIDPNGRILDALPLNEAGFLDVALPAPLPPTLYARLGDWPIVAFLILGYLLLCLRQFRNKH